MIFFAIRLIIAAFILYTIALFSAKFSKSLKGWMVGLLSFGFLVDIIGTVIMSNEAGGVKFTLHTYAGFTAISLIAFWLIFGISAKIKGGKWEVFFRKGSLYVLFAWLLLTFGTGIYQYYNTV
jgi:uncharacterized repeat protein (TIGR03987 family)